jgi:protein-tyrosine-phosphatase
VKTKGISRSHELAEELLEEEIVMVDSALSSRKSHLRSIDKLERKGAAPKKRRTCPTKKRAFRDKKEADRVLHFIMNNRKEAVETGGNYRFVQYRSYLCGCGAYHHSSRPELGSLESLNVA